MNKADELLNNLPVTNLTPISVKKLVAKIRDAMRIPMRKFGEEISDRKLKYYHDHRTFDDDRETNQTFKCSPREHGTRMIPEEVEKSKEICEIYRQQEVRLNAFINAYNKSSP